MMHNISMMHKSNKQRKRKMRSNESRYDRERRLARNRILQHANDVDVANRSVQNTLDNTERINMNRRILRAKVTRERNLHAQKVAVTQNENSNEKCNSNRYSPREEDDRNFYNTINEQLTFICGSCGELSNMHKIKIVKYDPESHFFFTLTIPGDTGLIEEAIVKDQNNETKVTFCETCYNSLTKFKVPKFSKRSGFRLGLVPDELAKLNDMEARMIGLGVCFTTCYRLKSGGQYATRGNCISFWNQICSTVSKLPRPVSKCGVIYLRSNSQRLGVYEIRPNYIRAALYWLIKNNPLYSTVEIDEELLQQLQEANNLPELIIEEEDVDKDTITSVCEQDSINNGESLNISRQTENAINEDIEIQCLNELEGNCIESFEMPTSNLDTQTESDRIVDALLNQTTMPVETSAAPELNITMNEYTNRHLMQQCFPSLFPDGLGGYNPVDNEDRMYSCHLAEYCAHLMMWHDRRFVIHPTFKFFCLNIIQRRQVDGLTKRAFNPDTNLPARGDDDDTIKQILRQLKPYFKTIRGSGLYWSNVRSELFAMLGSEAMPERWPTFFFTFSAADTIWPDFFRACNPMLSIEEASNLPSDERNRYLNQYPDMAVRHFYRRFIAFMTHIILGKSKPIGHVVDYFWRVEFQKRGSPHIHGLLWIKDAPDVNELSKTDEGRLKLAEFVDQNIHTRIKTLEELQDCECDFCLNERNNNSNPDILTRQPPSNVDYDDCDLRRVVNRVQQHICFPTSSCRLKNGSCRFSFPKQLRETTIIEIDQVSEGVKRLQVHCKRNNPYINNFNSILIVRWRANMDLKLIGNAYGAAEYTAAYVSKSEPDTSRFRNAIRNALGRTNDSSNPYTTLRRVANATIAVREVSAQEAMWILLPGLMMTNKTRAVVKVKTLRHCKRSYRVSADDCLRMVGSNSHDNLDQPRIDALEKLYMARPDENPFTSMTYRYFCEHYEESIQAPQPKQKLKRFKRNDNSGYIKSRSINQVILKCPSIKPNIHDPDYCFQELLLGTSWKDISDLPTDDNECVLAFESFQASNTKNTQRILEMVQRAHAMELIDSLETPVELRLPINDWGMYDPSNNHTNLEIPQTINNAGLSLTICTVEEYTRAEKFITTEVLNHAKAHRREQEHYDRNVHYMYPIGLAHFNMNEDQWVALAICMQQSRLRKDTRSNACNPMALILNGEGGSGKSWLINHIVKDVYEVFDRYQERQPLRVLLLAHQGTAAFNIRGLTICSALAIPRNYSNTYVSFDKSTQTLRTLQRLQDKYEHVHLVIIDEFSVISCTLLYWIDHRLREIFPSHNDIPFGGRDVVIAGDMGQLTPVNASSLSTPEHSLRTEVEVAGRNTWTNITTVCSLHSQNRGLNDEEWYNALRRLRTMDETYQDVQLFNTRVQSSSLDPAWMHTATHIAYRNESVNEINEQCIMQQVNQVFEFYSYYNYSEKDANSSEKITEEMIASVYTNLTTPKQARDLVVAHKIRLAIGASVSLTYNVCQEAGLCNGTKGIVHDIITCPEKKLPIILVRITDKYFGPSFLDIPNIIPIIPKTISCSVNNNLIQVTRTGIPLRLAYGMTVHKVQGLTCSKVVFNPTAIPSSSFAYVALSRVRAREDIILTQPLQLNKSPYQLKHKKTLQDECARLEELATITKQKNQELIRKMQYLAKFHNENT